MSDDHLVGEFGERHGGQGEVQPLQPQRREGDDQAERRAHQHHQNDADRIAVLSAEV
jgi:hypothetical protein